MSMTLETRLKKIPFLSTLSVYAFLLVTGFFLGYGPFAQRSRLHFSTSRNCSNVVESADDQHIGDWRVRPRFLEGDRVFNKSIFYVKPHKTGSESFKKILLEISDYYNLTNEMQEEQRVSTKNQRRKVNYDVLIRHQYYHEGISERAIRGWDDGDFEVGKNGELPKRQMTKVVTTRNPIDRLFSHYFSQRRFTNFIPRRGNVKPGTLSEQEELRDFLEWLEDYPAEQQVRYLMDTPRETGQSTKIAIMLQRIQKIVDFYDHVIVADQWKQSLCLFGFTEGINPQLLRLRTYNSNKARARRFDVQKAISDTSVFARILAKVRYDFFLYQALLKKFTKKLDDAPGPELQRYCAFVK